MLCAQYDYERMRLGAPMPRKGGRLVSQKIPLDFPLHLSQPQPPRHLDTPTQYEENGWMGG